MDNQLPTGFITVDEALNIINGYDGGTEGVVPDITGMIQRHRWIEPAHSFRLRFCRFVADKFGRVKKQKATSKYAFVQDSFEAESIKHALSAKFRELSGQEFSMDNFRSITTAVDPDDKNSGRPRVNTRPVAKVGDVINSTQQVVTGENA